MENKRRTFKQLTIEKNLQEFNDFAKKITENYAKSAQEYSQTSVAVDNNLTVKALRKIMDYAIVTALVSIDVAEKVLNKAMYNQKRKKQDAGSSSINHHKELIRQRNEYITYSYTYEEVKKIAEDIAGDFSKDISCFTKKYEIESDTITKNLLQRSIVENIVTDSIVEKLVERSTKKDKSLRTMKYFENIMKQRKDYIQRTSR